MENYNENFALRTYVYADPQLPKTILNNMIKKSKKLSFKNSTTGKGIDPKRTSSNSWLYVDSWIAGILHNIMIGANADYFHYDLVHFDESIQVTKYDKEQQYGWHIDQAPMKNKNHLPRKLSLTFLLNDDFEGGELQIYSPCDQKIITLPMRSGCYCVFPSWVVHRVKPVISGTRYSLVAWMNGPQFR